VILEDVMVNLLSPFNGAINQGSVPDLEKWDRSQSPNSISPPSERERREAVKLPLSDEASVMVRWCKYALPVDDTEKRVVPLLLIVSELC
jgi:hypothetical protein